MPARFINILKALAFLILLLPATVSGQSPWPSESWANATNLTSVMNASGLTELSGLFWNNVTNRLYVSHGDGRFRVLQHNTANNTYSQIGNLAISGGPEGITQVDPNSNEIFTIDEDNYQIRKYTYTSNFSSVTLSRSWSITASPSTMTNTGNTGPEGIAFIPDSFLTAMGFISQVTGLPYTSTKGMGGLMFIAHQNQGIIWVFDLNPTVSNNFAFVGKYKTDRLESCDLAFDRSTGLLYVLHNILGNTIEVTDLTTTALSGGERKFNTKYNYSVSNPLDTNQNVEGLAIKSKCTDSTNVDFWLCRDVESVEPVSLKLDCLRLFNPFTAPGYCNPGVQITLELRILIEGYYSGGTMSAALNLANPNICDSITVELRHQTSHSVVYSLMGVIDINGNGVFVFPSSMFGKNFYLAVKHRNALETWSATPISFTSAVVRYTFTDGVAKAYGGKQRYVGGGNWAFYSGDLDQNGFINEVDYMLIRNKLNDFQNGYQVADLNGDFVVESSDFSFIENNYQQQIFVSKP